MPESEPSCPNGKPWVTQLSIWLASEETVYLLFEIVCTKASEGTSAICCCTNGARYAKSMVSPGLGNGLGQSLLMFSSFVSLEAVGTVGLGHAAGSMQVCVFAHAIDLDFVCAVQAVGFVPATVFVGYGERERFLVLWLRDWRRALRRLRDLRWVLIWGCAVKRAVIDVLLVSHECMCFKSHEVAEVLSMIVIHALQYGLDCALNHQ